MARTIRRVPSSDPVCSVILQVKGNTMHTPSLYITTADEKNHSHHYRLPVTDTVPEGHEITGVRPAGLFRLSSVLSPESLKLLKAIK